MTCGALARNGLAIGVGVVIQLAFLIFAVWYGQALDHLFCKSSFVGSPACPDGRPARLPVLYGAPLIGLLLGGIGPPRLFGASWKQTVLLLIVISATTVFIIVAPVILVIALIRAQA